MRVAGTGPQGWSGVAAFANTAGADLVLSLHTDSHPTALAHGVVTFHFGSGTGLTSTLGEALAQFIQRELTARTGMLDCGTHPIPGSCSG